MKILVLALVVLMAGVIFVECFDPNAASSKSVANMLESTINGLNSQDREKLQNWKNNAKKDQNLYNDMWKFVVG